MYPSRESLAGMLCILGLVAAAHWFASSLGGPHRPAWLFNAGDSRSRSIRIGVRNIDWSADGRKLLAHARDWDGNQSLVLHTLSSAEDAMPIDLMRQPTGAAALAPDGRHVLVGTNCGKLCWIGVE